MIALELTSDGVTRSHPASKETPEDKEKDKEEEKNKDEDDSDGMSLKSWMNKDWNCCIHSSFE